MVTAQHTSATDQHGSPPEFVLLAHKTMGGVDVDPASSPAWNALVRATRVIGEAEDGTRTPWFAGAPKPAHAVEMVARRTAYQLPPRALRRVFINPPGSRDGELVALFWRALAAYVALGWCTSAVWIGFNLEQLARLQRVGACSHPLLHTTLMPAKRAGYRPDPRSLAIDPQPPHASFVTLLSANRDERALFTSLARKLGHVIPSSL